MTLDEAISDLQQHISIRRAGRDRAMAKLTSLANDKDIERSHLEADAVLCELLRSLGFDDVVDAFERLEKWYG